MDERDYAAQDEIDALRALLLAELRRRPGDIPSLIRRAEVIARMIADQGRISPHRREHIQKNLMRFMGDMGMLLPPDGEERSADS